jgi:hypothetical protein
MEDGETSLRVDQSMILLQSPYIDSRIADSRVGFTIVSLMVVMS